MLNARSLALAGVAVGVGATVLATSVIGDDGGPALDYNLVLEGADGVTARAAFEPDDEGTEVHLWVDGLPPGGKAVYEV